MTGIGRLEPLAIANVLLAINADFRINTDEGNAESDRRRAIECRSYFLTIPIGDMRSLNRFAADSGSLAIRSGN